MSSSPMLLSRRNWSNPGWVLPSAKYQVAGSWAEEGLTQPASTGSAFSAVAVAWLWMEAPRGRSPPTWTMKVTTASSPGAMTPAGSPGEFTGMPEASGEPCSASGTRMPLRVVVWVT